MESGFSNFQQLAMFYKLTIVIAAVLLTHAAPIHAADPREVTLADAVALAMRSSPDLAAAARELNIARAEIERANYIRPRTYRGQSGGLIGLGRPHDGSGFRLNHI